MRLDVKGFGSGTPLNIEYLRLGTPYGGTRNVE